MNDTVANELIPLRSWLAAGELIRHLRERNIELWVDAERLRYRAPAGALSDDLRELVGRYKPQLIDLLRDRNATENGDIAIRPFLVSPFMAKCYVCHSDGQAVIIDPGCITPAEQRAVLDYVERNHLEVVDILLTHAHIDHFFGCAELLRHFSCGYRLHEADIPLLEDSEVQARMVGTPLEIPPPPERVVNDGDVISFGSAHLQAVHCPGHSKGSVCFHDPEHKLLFSGDVLFRGAVGSIIMPGGDISKLLESIHTKLMRLDEQTVVYPGHGPATTLEAERQSNRWLAHECGIESAFRANLQGD
ncbi:MBL fold metallo-hydrolase [Haliangium ochraceum]|uniref:Beta-lactamase domain protein n=1 Tax=Haliangium ochraceum (strain DSM 14365 / JCM 11303 / SMP-2) TaxID=502025 RepID=D0LS41_HALO1|nr:MBL fold metallo-hydrolase [Haliangium ochraceum]ACY13738.1 beta-lactamase domain protein [Haliangium ochraceum DSM 14365]AMM72006.1 metallo-beta-lactamase type thioesterase [Haliangium ochraceum DSM 14365]